MSTDAGVVRFERRGAIATITFDRPSARNAMTWAMYEQLDQALDRVASEPDVRVCRAARRGRHTSLPERTSRSSSAFTSGDDGVAYERRLEAVHRETRVAARRHHRGRGGLCRGRRTGARRRVRSARLRRLTRGSACRSRGPSATASRWRTTRAWSPRSARRARRRCCSRPSSCRPTRRARSASCIAVSSPTRSTRELDALCARLVTPRADHAPGHKGSRAPHREPVGRVGRRRSRSPRVRQQRLPRRRRGVHGKAHAAVGRSLTRASSRARSRAALARRDPLRHVHAPSLLNRREPVRHRAVRRRVPARRGRRRGGGRGRRAVRRAGAAAWCGDEPRRPDRRARRRARHVAAHASARSSLDADAQTARVQPGLIQDDLNKAAGAHRLMFAPDTSTSNRATLGGMIGNNSCGARSARYGMTIDHVESLDVVLSDGSRARFGPRRRVGGRVARSAATRSRRDCIATCPSSSRSTRRRSVATSRRSGESRAAIASSGCCPSAARSISRTSSSGRRGRWRSSSRPALGSCRSPRRWSASPATSRRSPAAIAAADDAREMRCGRDRAGRIASSSISRGDRPRTASSSPMLDGDPGALLWLEFYGDTPAEARAAAERLEARWRAHRHGYAVLRARDRASS